MTITRIDTWDGITEKKAKLWAEAITKIIYEEFDNNLDEIQVYINLVSPSHWSQAGIMGNDDSWIEKSKRKSYGE
ncbi:tautomerase family protein [Companilactobacillus metriopterae]|uniref:tautomerase family protein n=1 Tax=Companilactobacillus metriopterae TaxID=1909267 RepID=UPI00100ACF55|nr:tautomerase [Companilactobacillus metriopterae]